MKFGEYLRIKRQERGLSTHQLAAMCNISQGYVSQLETRDEKLPSNELIHSLSEALELPPDRFLELAGRAPEKESFAVISNVVRSIRLALEQSYGEFAERLGIRPEELRQLEECKNEDEVNLFAKAVGSITLAELVNMENALSEEDRTFFRQLEVNYIRGNEQQRALIRNVCKAVLESM